MRGITTNLKIKSDFSENSEKSSSSENLKQKQLEIINRYNPMLDDYHTGIRTVEDIKTLEETLNDDDWKDYGPEINPDLSVYDLEEAIKSGQIKVYSSYPIEQGTFVSPSYMEAQSYSGGEKVYSANVSIEDIAWIDPTQGQYAKVKNEVEKQKTEKNDILRNSKDDFEIDF